MSIILIGIATILNGVGIILLRISVARMEKSIRTMNIENYIADEVLPLARRQLVTYEFGDSETLPKGQKTP